MNVWDKITQVHNKPTQGMCITFGPEISQLLNEIKGG
jgi:hypothetical protein